MLNKQWYWLGLALFLSSGPVRGDIGEGLISHWRLSETEGTVAADSVGGNDGTVMGDAVWAEGKIGGGIVLDGDGDYIFCGNDPSLDVDDQITLAAWAYLDPDFDYPDWCGLIMKGGGPDGGADTYALYAHFPSQRIGFATAGTDKGWFSTDATEELFADGEWHHFAGAYDGEDKNIYLDGELQKTHPSGGLVNDTRGNVYLGAGRDLAEPTHLLVGGLDDARIYRRGLCWEDVLYLTQANELELGLLSHWRLGETEGSVAVDSVAGNDGTLMGDTAWAEGKIGGGVVMDGDGDYIFCGNDPSFDVDDQLTLSAWAQLDPNFDYPDWCGLIMKGGGPDGGADTYALYAHFPSQRIGFATAGTDKGWLSTDAAEDLFADGEWHHFAGAYDGVDKNIYLDGELHKTHVSGGLVKDSTGNVYLGAGRDLAEPTHLLVGGLDDARIYTRGLYANEVQALVQTNELHLGLSSHWRLCEGKGTTAKDSVGSNDGTLMGDTSWAEGKIGGGVLLDGDGDYIFCGNDPSFNVDDQLTLSAWAQLDPNFDYPDWCGLIMKGGGPDGGADTYALYAHFPSQRIGFATAGTDKGWLSTDAAQDLFTDGEWHHFAGAYDGVDKNIYMDGELQKTHASGGLINDTTGNVYLGAGRDLAVPTHLLVGGLDDARIYTRGLYANEISSLFGPDEHDPGKAYEPVPMDMGMLTVFPPTLQWMPGDTAGAHDVYLGTAKEDVESATTDDPRDVLLAQGIEETYFATGPLTFGGTYFWRIDEVNDSAVPSVIKGDTWSFTVADALIIDDFEKYDDLEFLEIWEFWADGYQNDENGAVVGNGNMGERFLVYEGGQSMPIHYNNSVAAISEVTRRFEPQLDFQEMAPLVLSLQIRGKVDNDSAPVYLTFVDTAGRTKRFSHPDTTICQSKDWVLWQIPMDQLQPVDPGSIENIAIGVGQPGAAPSGARGTLFIDLLQVEKPPITN